MATKMVGTHDSGSMQIAQEVRHLFETKTIEDMRKLEANTRKEVEDKRQELRNLIGARYRDLIESADSIVVMKQNADLLLSSISTMRGEGQAGPPKPLWTPKGHSKASDVLADRKRKFAAASKLKSVLETPEHIWAALEREKYLEASLLFHQAQVLHAALRSEPSSFLLFNAMPVAPRQWNLVCQFPAKINSASQTFLAKPDQSPEQYLYTYGLELLWFGVSLICLPMLLRYVHWTQLIESLSRDASGSKNKDALVQSLRNCAAAIATTFYLVFYIFTCPTSQHNPKNLKLSTTTTDKDITPRGAKHALHGTHLHATTQPTPPYFYSTLQTIKDDLDAIYKTHDIDHKDDSGSSAFFSLHIPTTSITTQTEQWLANNSQHFQALARKLLSHVAGAQILAQVRDNLKTGIEEVVASPDAPWETVSQSVLGRELNLWETLCTDVFYARSREIVAHSFETVDFDSALKVLLKTPSVSVGAGLWTAESARDDKEIATIQNKAAGLTHDVSEFVRKFDTMLTACLSDLAYLTQTVQEPTPAPPPSPSLRPPPSPRIAQSPMKLALAVSIPTVNPLEVYVQDRCFAGVTSFLGTVRKRLEVLQASILAAKPSSSNLISITTTVQTTPSTPEEEETRKQVDESLLIAQSARALSAYSKQLSAALVPNTPQATTTSSTPSTPVRKTRPQADKGNETNARLVAIKSTLRQCYLHGYVLWAKWVTATHVQWLSSCVNRDSWSDSTRLQGWEEHKVMVENEDGPVEEKVYLPFQPSPYVLDFLFAVCCEIHRAGGHTIHRIALEYLARELATAVLDLYDNVALAHQGGGASKEGGVQLLCDACFLIDVLSVPDHSLQSDEDLRAVLPSLAPDSAVSGSSTEGRLVQAMAWGRRVDKTVDALKDLLDPIELAYYEAHVKSFVTRCYQRSSVLFGALVQLHRPQDGQTKATPVSEPNIIPLARPTARFGYLPTSVPTPTATPTRIIAPPTSLSSSSLASDTNSRRPLSLMEQGVDSLKKFTSLNSMFSLNTSPQPTHASNTSATPPKQTAIPWFL